MPRELFVSHTINHFFLYTRSVPRTSNGFWRDEENFPLGVLIWILFFFNIYQAHLWIHKFSTITLKIVYISLNYICFCKYLLSTFDIKPENSIRQLKEYRKNRAFGSFTGCKQETEGPRMKQVPKISLRKFKMCGETVGIECARELQGFSVSTTVCLNKQRVTAKKYYFIRCPGAL